MAAAKAGVSASKSDARRTVGQGGAYVNNEPAPDGRVVTAADLLHDRWLLLRRGKKEYRLVEAG